MAGLRLIKRDQNGQFARVNTLTGAKKIEAARKTRLRLSIGGGRRSGSAKAARDKQRGKGGTAAGKLPLKEAGEIAAKFNLGRDNKSDENKAAYREASKVARELKRKDPDGNTPTADRIYSTAKKVKLLSEEIDGSVAAAKLKLQKNPEAQKDPTPIKPTEKPGAPSPPSVPVKVQEGDVVKLGKSGTRWRVTGVEPNLIGLKSLDSGATKALKDRRMISSHDTSGRAKVAADGIEARKAADAKVPNEIADPSDEASPNLNGELDLKGEERDYLQSYREFSGMLTDALRGDSAEFNDPVAQKDTGSNFGPTKAATDAIDSALSRHKLQKPTRVRRVIKNVDLTDIMADIDSGSFTDKSYMSTWNADNTTNAGALVKAFGGQFFRRDNSIVLEMDLPAGFNALDLRQKDFGDKFPDEVLLPRNTTWKVNSVTDDGPNGARVVHLTPAKSGRSSESTTKVPGKTSPSKQLPRTVSEIARDDKTKASLRSAIDDLKKAQTPKFGQSESAADIKAQRDAKAKIESIRATGNSTNGPGELSKDEAKAISLYRENSSNMNGALRSGYGNDALYVQALDAAMSRSTTAEPVKVRRFIGASVGSAGTRTDYAAIKKQLESGSFKDLGFMSTEKAEGTSVADMVHLWSDEQGKSDIVLEIDVPKGMNALELNHSDLNDNHLSEVVLPRGLEWDVEKTGVVSGATVYKLTPKGSNPSEPKSASELAKDKSVALEKFKKLTDNFYANSEGRTTDPNRDGDAELAQLRADSKAAFAEVERVQKQLSEMEPDRSEPLPKDPKNTSDVVDVMQNRHPAVRLDGFAENITSTREAQLAEWEARGIARYRAENLVANEKVSASAARSFLVGLDGQMVKYPGVNVTDINATRLGSTTNASGSGQIGAECGCSGHNFIRITVNTEAITDAPKVVRNAREASGTIAKHHFPGYNRAPYRYNAIHEFGHAVDHFANLDIDGSAKTPEQRQAIAVGVHIEVAGILKQAWRDEGSPKDVNSTDDKAFSDWLLTNMSGYSINNERAKVEEGFLPDVNVREALAEAWVDGEMNGETASPTSKALHRYLQTKLKDANRYEGPISFPKVKKETRS
jgi:hypothetical protein